MSQVEVIPGQVTLMPGEWTANEAASYVTDAYAKSVLAVIETGRRLIESKEKLAHGQWLPLIERLPFSEATAQRFMQIANHPDLGLNPAHVRDLPTSWSTLAVLAQLPPGEINARIEAGEITPELDRATAQGWAAIYQAAKQESINAWIDFVDAVTNALSWAKSYTPPDNLPASHVQVSEVLERYEALGQIIREWE